MSDDIHGEVMQRPEQVSKVKRIRFIVGLLAGVAAFYLVVGSATEGGTYFYTVGEAMAQDEIPTHRMIRVKGLVFEGSWKKPVSPSKVHKFVIADEGGQMKVRFDGPLPDVFQEGGEVVATGRYKNGQLEATEVTAKCPSKYEEGQLSDEAKKRMGITQK